MRIVPLLPFLVLLNLAAATPASSQAARQDLRWFKGNTHSHSLNSDGDVAPDELVTAYRALRYHFLVITDHNFVTPVEGLNALHGAEQRFLVIRGEEVTDRAPRTVGGKSVDKPVHLNLLGGTATIQPQGGPSPAEALRRDLAEMSKAGGVIQINHPNYGWTFTPADLDGSPGARLLEVFNGHPQVNNAGGGGLPSAEALWDAMLTAGQRVFAVASDDTHGVKQPGSRSAPYPGRGWVVVRASRLTPEEILGALERGDFYATTGVELSDIDRTPTALTVTVREQSFARYTVQFIGKGGRLLKTVESSPARYDLTGTEGYVRAKVLDSNGWIAWSQPVWIR